MFSKNIESLKLCNMNLAKKLENYSFDKAREVVDIGYAKSSDVVFIKNNMPLESTENPVEEAFYNIQSNVKADLEKFDFLIMYGLGIGYMLDYAFDKYPSRLLVVEPDINVLRVAFEMVDYTKYLDTGRVFITDSADEIYDFISDKYIVNDKVEMAFLKSYISMYSNEIKDFTNKIYDTCMVKMTDVNTIRKNSEKWVYASINYIKNCGQTYPISLLDNHFEGRTALILGAGPSLKENIEYIKKYRDRFAIFAVNRTLKFLTENSIIPDFAVFTDTSMVQYTVDMGVKYLNEMNFITDIKVDTYVYGLNKKRCFTYFPNNFDLAKLLSEKIADIKLYDTAGTATFSALNSAKNLGFKNIILCGSDLAFKDGAPYCCNSPAIIDGKELKYGLTVKKIVQVKSVTGKMVDTREDYAIFVKQFEKFIKQNQQLKIYNVTDFGANIDGSIVLDFPKVMEQIPVPADLNSTDDVICKMLYDTKFNPIELKKTAKEVIAEEQKENFEIRAAIKTLYDNDLKDELFFIKTLQILEKINKTALLSQLLQFELLASTKDIILKDVVARRAKLELFLEKVFEKVETLGQKMSVIQ